MIKINFSCLTWIPLSKLLCLLFVVAVLSFSALLLTYFMQSSTRLEVKGLYFLLMSRPYLQRNIHRNRPQEINRLVQLCFTKHCLVAQILSLYLDLPLTRVKVYT